MKMARGGMGPDELAEVLGAAGIEADFSPVAQPDAEPAFEELVSAVQAKGSSLVRIRMKMKGGTFTGLLVLNQVGTLVLNQDGKPSLKRG